MQIKMFVYQNWFFQDFFLYNIDTKKSPFNYNHVHEFFIHEIVLKLNLNSITKRTIHVKCAVPNCDSYARNCHQKNNENINFIDNS